MLILKKKAKCLKIFIFRAQFSSIHLTLVVSLKYDFLSKTTDFLFPLHPNVSFQINAVTVIH